MSRLDYEIKQWERTTQNMKAGLAKALGVKPVKLSELANTLVQRIKELIKQEAEPIMTNKGMARYGRKLEPGCIAIRVLIVANGELGDLGKMELFVPVSKKRLKEAPDSVLASVLRFIQQAAEYRADMIAMARERVTA